MEKPSTYVSKQVLVAHRDWWKRGRKGAGRIVYENARIKQLVGAGLELSGSEFRDSLFESCVINLSRWKEADLRSCTFRSCEFEAVDFDRSKLAGCRFEGCHFVLARFLGTRFERCVATSSNLARTTWTDAITLDTDFSESFLKLARLGGGKFMRCSFRGVDFTDATAERAVFMGCDFTGAKGGNWTGAGFMECVASPRP